MCKGTNSVVVGIKISLLIISFLNLLKISEPLQAKNDCVYLCLLFDILV